MVIKKLDGHHVFQDIENVLSKQGISIDYSEETETVIAGFVDRQFKSEANNNLIHHCKPQVFILIDQ